MKGFADYVGSTSLFGLQPKKSNETDKEDKRDAAVAPAVAAPVAPAVEAAVTPPVTAPVAPAVNRKSARLTEERIAAVAPPVA